MDRTTVLKSHPKAWVILDTVLPRRPRKLMLLNLNPHGQEESHDVAVLLLKFRQIHFCSVSQTSSSCHRTFSWMFWLHKTSFSLQYFNESFNFSAFLLDLFSLSDKNILLTFRVLVPVVTACAYTFWDRVYSASVSKIYLFICHEDWDQRWVTHTRCHWIFNWTFSLLILYMEG